MTGVTAYPLCPACVQSVVEFPSVIVGETMGVSCVWCGYEADVPMTLVRPVAPLVFHGDAA
jgi:hypothetical protein